jgi:hypothetical protein
VLCTHTMNPALRPGQPSAGQTNTTVHRHSLHNG